MTAVPDVRRQCELLALHLAGLVKAAPGAQAAVRKPEGLSYAI
jgi:hypothetical protein